MPEKTRRNSAPDGYFVTGDLGEIDAGRLCHIVGRVKDMIISGGLNVYPKEIERVIDEMPGVVESAVIGLAHPDFGEGVTAVMVAGRRTCDGGGGCPRPSTGRLAKYKEPKRVPPSSTNCRATEWGKCRRPFCGRRTRTLSGKGAGPAGGGRSTGREGRATSPRRAQRCAPNEGRESFR